MTVKCFRTPDDRFEGLADFPFAPHYLEWNGMRMHHLDEGPRHGPVALLLHGEPTWSFLYRKMIPPLVAAGFRCIAPDHAGFGRSDKPVDDSWYVIERHCERVRHLIETLDLRRIAIFVQDWGGPIGLRQVVDLPDRFDRLVIMNTWLHHQGYEYTPGIRAWRAAATHPWWLAWTRGELPVAGIMRGGSKAVARSEAALRGYEAPFPPGGESRAGPRRFPWCIPFAEPEAGNATDQERCFEALKRWSKPAHFVFGDADPVFPASWGEAWSRSIADATFDAIPGVGHFVQEDAGETVVDKVLRRAGLA